MKKLLLIAVALVAIGCTHSPNTAERLLQEEGVSSPTLQGHAWYGCGKGDDYATKFSGVKNGKKVTGVICGGFLKGNTIRYF
jgi:hypothetical protein